MSSTGEHAVDRLSSLPQDILSHILSLMPTKSAMRTSLLSKTWRYTWTFVHNVYFDTTEDRKYLYPKDVDWVLERCKIAQVKIFRVHFSSYYDSESYWRELISKAIGLNVPKLDIKGEYLKLPTSLFTYKTLRKLKLDCIKSPSRSSICQSFSCPSFVNLPNLKTLDVVIQGQYWGSALKLIHGCPVLENLYVKMGCWNNEGDNYFKIPTLKQLNLKVNDSCSELITDNVVINLPNLEYFVFDGFMDFPFVIEEMPSLIRAKASCVVCHGDRLVQLLKAINQAKSISLNTEDWSHVGNHLDLPTFFPNLKQLELEGYVGHQWKLIPQFLNRTPKLEHLSIGKFSHDYRWNKPKSIPTCMRMSLKTVKYTNGCGYHDLEFLKFVLAYSKVLKTLTVECDFKFIQPKEKDLVRAYMTKHLKASKNCDIRLRFCSALRKSSRSNLSAYRHFATTLCTATLANPTFRLMFPIAFSIFPIVLLYSL